MKKNQFILGTVLVAAVIGTAALVLPATEPKPINPATASPTPTATATSSPAASPAGAYYTQEELNAMARKIVIDTTDEWKKAHPTPTPSPTPTATATPTPSFTPDPEILAFANAMLAQRPWLEARSSDPNFPPGASPATTFVVSRVEPIVTQDGDTWKITFKP